MKNVKNKISRISVTSTRNLGLQVAKDYLTATEKKILIYMLNAGMSVGTVRNKCFCISKTDNNNAVVVIKTTTFSIIVGRKETTRYTVGFKYS